LAYEISAREEPWFDRLDPHTSERKERNKKRREPFRRDKRPISLKIAFPIEKGAAAIHRLRYVFIRSQELGGDVTMPWKRRIKPEVKIVSPAQFEKKGWTLATRWLPVIVVPRREEPTLRTAN
jgi:hypothetical protein